MDNYNKDKHIAEIFKSLKKNKVSIEVWQNLFLDCKIDYFFDYLPDEAKDDIKFLKKCFSNKSLHYKNLPNKFKSADFFTKEEYKLLLEKNLIDLKENLYPQDREIVLSACLLNSDNFKDVEESFKLDGALVVECLSKNARVSNFLDKKTIQKVLREDEHYKKILLRFPAFYKELEDKEKIQSKYLIAILQSNLGESHCVSYLRRNSDPLVAIEALEVRPGLYNKLHQKYIMLLKDVPSYEKAIFLKKYIEMQELKEVLGSKENRQINKTKI